MVDWLLEYNLIPQSIGMPNRPGIVHRLDRDTSGILLIARTMHGLAALGSLFANRMVHKTYLAVVQGHTPESGVINSFIGRDPVTKVKMKAHHVQFDHTFRTAVTEFKTVKHCDTYSIINAFPKQAELIRSGYTVLQSAIQYWQIPRMAKKRTDQAPSTACFCHLIYIRWPSD